MSPPIDKRRKKGEFCGCRATEADLKLFAAAGALDEETGSTWLRRVAQDAAKAGVVVEAPDGGQRSENLTLRVHATHKEQIEAAAAKAKLTVSDYIVAVGRAKAKELGVK